MDHQMLLYIQDTIRDYSLGFFTPYFDREVALLATPVKSYAPLTRRYLTPGKSWTLPPLTSTTWCSCKLCPSPGIKHDTTFPLVSLTLQHFLWAELGFLGLTIITLKTTPFLNGLLPKCGALDTYGLTGLTWLPLLIWFNVAYRFCCWHNEGTIGVASGMFVRMDARYDDTGLWTGTSVRTEGPSLDPNNVLSIASEERKYGNKLLKKCAYLHRREGVAGGVDLEWK